MDALARNTHHLQMSNLEIFISKKNILKIKKPNKKFNPEKVISVILVYIWYLWTLIVAHYRKFTDSSLSTNEICESFSFFI